MEKPSSERQITNLNSNSESNGENPSTTSTVPKPNQMTQVSIKRPSKRCLEKTKIMKRYIESNLNQKNIEKISN